MNCKRCLLHVHNLSEQTLHRRLLIEVSFRRVTNDDLLIRIVNGRRGLLAVGLRHVQRVDVISKKSIVRSTAQWC